MTPAKLVLSQSTRFEFKHQPLNLFSASGRYTWGDDSPEDARRRGKVVERRRERLEGEGWNIIRDKNAMRSGDLISGFMKRIGRADRVIVVLSDKYLRSPYCMTELHTIYRRSNEEKEEFLRRIIPLLLGDARIGKWDDRLTYATGTTSAFPTRSLRRGTIGDFGPSPVAPLFMRF